MRIELAHISPRRGRLKSTAAQALLDDYVAKAARYTPCAVATYETEAQLLSVLDRPGRTATGFVLLDSRGEPLTSQGFAARLAQQADTGRQHLICAIGPPDGWSSAAWTRAQLHISFGAMTLPHELALVILAEQIYRALTIQAGHPYHSGH